MADKKTTGGKRATDKPAAAKAPAAPKSGKKKGAAALPDVLPPAVPQPAGAAVEPPHGDPLRPAVAADAAFTGQDLGATRHGEHHAPVVGSPTAGTADSQTDAMGGDVSWQEHTLRHRHDERPGHLSTARDDAEAWAPAVGGGVSTGAEPDPMVPGMWTSGEGQGQAPTEAGSTAAPLPAEAFAGVEGSPAVVQRTRDARVGLFVGREWSFPPEFLKAVERRDAGVVAELAKIGGPRFDDAPAYDLCIDRISHEVPMYRSYLKQVALRGSTVVNNPFMWTADDKFFGAALADRLGVASPKTVVLPNREYVPGIVPSESLRNLEYPLDWQGILEYVGLPCILKDAHGGGWKEVYVCNTAQELLHHYNNSGLLTMIVQEFIQFEHFVRCLVIGGEHVLPMKYDPRERKYIVDHNHLTPELGSRIVGDARKLCRALGYDMNSMEFAIRDGVPYAIDFMNPAPDMDVNSLTPTYFEWAVETMADLAVELATATRDGKRAVREPAWSSLFGGAAAGLPAGGR